ncbi:MAG: hypothetical protein ACR2P4_03775 [Gammaproteobacteria bacterium]
MRFALCYNIAPLQGFKNAPLRGDGLGDSRFRGNDGNLWLYGFPLLRE